MMPTLTIAALQKLNRPTVLRWGFRFVLCYRLLATACGHGEPTAERRSRSRTGLADAQSSHDGERIRAQATGVKRMYSARGHPRGLVVLEDDPLPHRPGGRLVVYQERGDDPQHAQTGRPHERPLGP